MNKDIFVKDVAATFDVDCHYNGSGNRTFTQMEKDAFLKGLYDYFQVNASTASMTARPTLFPSCKDITQAVTYGLFYSDHFDVQI